jgi:hypothetical protein
LNPQLPPIGECHTEVSPVYGTFFGLGILKEELQFNQRLVFA